MRSKDRQLCRRAGLTALLLLYMLAGSFVYSQEPEGVKSATTEDPLLKIIDQSMEQYGSGGQGGLQGEAVDPPKPPSFLGMTFKLVFALSITVALIYFTVAMLRKFFFKPQDSKSPHIRVLSRSFISPKTAVYVVAVPGKIILVAEGQGCVTTLTEIAMDKFPEGLGDLSIPQAGGKNFADELSKIETEMNPAGLVSKVQGAIQSIQEKAKSFPGRKK